MSRYYIVYRVYRLYPIFFWIWRYVIYRLRVPIIGDIFAIYSCCFTIELALAEIKVWSLNLTFQFFYMYFYMALYMYIWYMVIYSDTIIHCRQRTQCYKSLSISTNWSPYSLVTTLPPPRCHLDYMITFRPVNKGTYSHHSSLWPKY